MYRQYLEQLKLRPNTSNKSKNKRNKRKRRSSAPSLFSHSDVTIITYRPEKKKSNDSKKRDKRIAAIDWGEPDPDPKPDGKRSRGGSPKDREKRTESESPERKPKENERRGTVEEIKTAFHVEDIDYHFEENTKAHHTNLFECTQEMLPDLVVRRGQSFVLTVKLDREYVKETHDLTWCFTIGEDPKPPKGTSVSIEMDEDPDGTCENPKQWYIKMIENDKKNFKVKVAVTPPCNCIVGEWDCSVETSFKPKPGDKPLKYRYECWASTSIIILLNPWCPHDLVYYENKAEPEKTETERQEYVMVERGCVYQGNYRQINAKAWDHGQFEGNNLKICLHLIRKYFNYVIDQKMGNPILLARAISAQVNSSCGGILEGNWSGNYEGGKEPWKWKSSTKILEEYNTKGQAVKFAQCWVFSAVTTTVCRAIGMPCRSITNFASAHDTDGSLRIDQEFYFDTEKKKLCRVGGHGDSIWNFHVWNDVWMCRPELGKGFDGWQAIDATPQELSEGEFRCGPASLCGIKRGDVTFPHDAGFIFAEANGDLCKWEKLSPNKWRLLSVLKDSVGKNISTKFPDGKPFVEPNWWGTGGTERQDITNEYKHPEGSEQERAAVQRAGKDIDEKYQIDEDLNDIRMDILIKDGALFGTSFEIKVLAKNMSKSQRKLTIEQRSVDIAQCSYDGIIDDEPFYEKTLDGAMEIPYMEEKEFSFQINPEDYENHLKTSPYSMAVKVEVFVKETKKTIMAEEPFFRLRRPDVLVEVPETVSGEFKMKLSLKNPFPKKKLTNCRFSITGGKIEEIEDRQIESKVVPADGTWKQEVTIKPRKKGEASISVDFDCDQIQDVEGTAKVSIL